MTTTAYDTAYRESQYRHNYPDGIQDHFWNLARNRLVHRLVGRLPGARGAVLDIGCGRGIVVDHLWRHGLDVSGCDTGTPAPIRDEVAPRLQLGRDAFELDAEYRDSVRVALLLDVLEHVERPQELTSRCRERFPGLEHLVVTVPARMEVWSRYDEYYGHFRRYDRPALASLFAAEHFELEDQGYFFHALYVVALGLSLLRARKEVEVRVPRGPVARVIHDVAGLAFDVEARLLPRSVVGMSLYAVLRVRR